MNRQPLLPHIIHRQDGPAGVAQIFNLLYRRIAFGRALELRETTGKGGMCGLQIRDTAECNSALRGLRLALRYWPTEMCLTTLLLGLWDSRAHAAPFEAVRTNQPGWTITWEGQVEFVGPQRAPVPVRTNQFLNFGDGLQTLALSRAVVRLQDWSDLRLKDRTRLEISLEPTPTPSPGLKLHEGQIYFTSRGGPQGIPIETPHARGVPKGTEFLVRVDVTQTEVTMFDGEVQLSNGVDSRAVHSGEQGIAVPGQPIQIRPILEARNIVQWWIYYPAVLDADELGLAPAEQAALADSLAAYRRGNLLGALRSFPGHPAPADPASDAQRSYLAALFLAVGSVDQAEALLAKGDSNAPPARALRTMIAAVSPPVAADVRRLTNSNPQSAIRNPQSSSELLALSYAHQSTNNLKAALEAARQAVGMRTARPREPHSAVPGDEPSALPSRFGFGWARVAELEFSFGHTRAAREAVVRALELSPENAQAHAVNGFLLAAEYKFRDAIAAFDQAIVIDPALGNAWLGRGLCRRHGAMEWWSGGVLGNQNSNTPILQHSWLADLQTAAALEPRRSLVRSYAGKGFSDAGQARLAHKEFHYAKQLDPNDPTPWLYSALELWLENRPNEAVRELERSIALNDNRAVYRSRLLLDQDHATRSASLAKVYQSAGLDDVALREAARAVSYDYASHSAHQFLAESYDALRDPTRFNLRYETVWFNELLLANLLSPVGAGLLSQNISQQEYSRLFEANRVGLLTSTEYRSDGQFREIASQYGLLGRFSYTLDVDYQHNEGTRPNNDLDRLEWYSQLKYQLTDRDSAFALIKYQDYESGDNFQHYDPANASRHLRLTETQTPIVLGALHREWQPGFHTTILGGHLESDQAYSLRSGRNTLPVVQTNDLVAPGISQFVPTPFSTLGYRSRFSAATLELNQVLTFEPHTLVAGARGQFGRFHTRDFIDTTNAADAGFFGTPVETTIDEEFWRASLYAYDLWRPWQPIQITAGVAYDQLHYPANFRFLPLSPGDSEQSQWSPKAGLQWDIVPSLTFRGVYARALGGVTFDESVRLEPTQVAGFPQAFRNVISEAEVGSVTAPHYTIGGAALDWSPGSVWNMGIRWDRLHSDVRQDLGAFYNPGTGPRPLPGPLRENLDYGEDTIGVHASRLLGNSWTLGGYYRFTLAEARFDYPNVPRFVNGQPIFEVHPGREEGARLHEVGLRCLFNHPSGFFASAESLWFFQENSGYPNSVNQTARPGDTVNQVNVSAGWRFWRRRGELMLSGLNLGGGDYRLNSLTPYQELPRERVFLVRLRLGW